MSGGGNVLICCGPGNNGGDGLGKMNGKILKQTKDKYLHSNDQFDTLSKFNKVNEIILDNNGVLLF